MLLCEISVAVARHQFTSVVNDLVAELYRINGTLEQMIDDGHGDIVRRQFASRTSRWFSQNFPLLLSTAHALRSNSKAFVAISKIEVSALTADRSSDGQTKQAGFKTFISNLKTALESIEAGAVYRKFESALHKCTTTMERGKQETIEANTVRSVPPKASSQPDIKGQQNSAVEQLVNNAIKDLPADLQHQARQAISKSDNKLKALQAFMQSMK